MNSSSQFPEDRKEGQDHNPDGDHVLGAMDVSIVGKFFSRSDTTLWTPSLRPKTVSRAPSERLGRFSNLREIVQPPGSPVVTATKSVFKNQGNSAAVRSGDIFENQNLIKFGQKNHDFFLAKF